MAALGVVIAVAASGSAGCTAPERRGARRASEWVALLDERDARVRARAAAHLAYFDTVAPEVLLALAHRLGDHDDRVRDATLTTFVQLRLRRTVDRRAIDALLAARLGEARDSMHRIALVRTLGAVGSGSQTAPAALLHALRDPSASVRCAATSALGQRVASNAAPQHHLLDAIAHDPSTCVRAESLALLAAAHDDRRAAGDSLSRLGGEVARLALSDSSPRVREQAAFALASIASPTPPVVEALLAAANDSASDVRSAIAHALGTLDVHGVTRLTRDEALRVALRDRAAAVRTMAARALARVERLPAAADH